MRALRLVSDNLEDAVAEILRELGASAERGPKGEHDLEVTFPEPFIRELGGGLVTRFSVKKRFVVEVKSSQREGAKLGELRQVHDWVLRESRRIVTPEDQEYYLSALEAASADAEFRLEGSEFDRSAGEEADAQEALRDLRKATELALNSLRYRVKGLLVINHCIALDGRGGRPFLEKNALEFARQNHIAVMSWQQLLEVGKSVWEGVLDPLNFWCLLFELRGPFEIANYDWRARATFQYDLFDQYEVTAETKSLFLRPEPEAMLGI